MELKKGQIFTFPKGLVHDFGQKCEIFSFPFCLDQIRQKKSFMTFQIES